MDKHEIPTSPRTVSPEDVQARLISMPTEQEWADMARAREAREAVEAEQKTSKRSYWQEFQRREKWKGRMKKVMATTALFATIKGGGFIDMAADPFSDAGDVAASAIPVAKVDIPTEIDGVPFDEYPADFREAEISQQTSSVEQENTARSTVVDLFERVDKEGYDGIIAEVKAEKSAHPELYADVEAAKDAKQAIDDAHTNTEVVSALNEFMHQYGIRADFYDDDTFNGRTDGVKNALKAYVNVFSALPKDLIAKAELTSVTVSDRGVTDSTQQGNEGGSYFPDEGEINIVAQNEAFALAARAEGVLERNDYSYESEVAHELGHALSEHTGVNAQLGEHDQLDWNKVGGKEIMMDLGRALIHRPDRISVYSASSDEENTAEALSGVLSDRSNGLASAEETIRFSSKANKEMIDMLAQLEAIRPGIAKILIANRVS